MPRGASLGSVGSAGSASVYFDGKAAARMGDPVRTCSDPSDENNGVVLAEASVFIG